MEPTCQCGRSTRLVPWCGEGSCRNPHQDTTRERQRMANESAIKLHDRLEERAKINLQDDLADRVTALEIAVKRLSG